MRRRKLRVCYRALRPRVDLKFGFCNGKSRNATLSQTIKSRLDELRPQARGRSGNPHEQRAERILRKRTCACNREGHCRWAARRRGCTTFCPMRQRLGRPACWPTRMRREEKASAIETDCADEQRGIENESDDESERTTLPFVLWINQRQNWHGCEINNETYLVSSLVCRCGSDQN